MLSLIGLDVFSDTETFNAYNNSNSTLLQYLIDEQFSDASICLIRNMIKNPYYDIDHLTTLQTTIKKYEATLNKFEIQIQKLRTYIKTNQESRENMSHVVDDSQNNDKTMIKNSDFVFFKLYLLKLFRCNQSEFCLTTSNIYNIALSPLMTFMTPILYILVPYSVLRYRLKVQISPSTYLSLLYNTFKMFRIRTKLGITVFVSYFVSFVIYLHTVFSSLFNSKNSYNACAHYISKINSFTSYLTKCVELLTIFEQSYSPPSIVYKWIQLQYDYNKATCEYTKNNLKDFRFGKKLAFYSNYKYSLFEEFFQYTDKVCAYLTIVFFKRKMNMCYSNFITSEYVMMKVVDSFHIFIDNPVKSSFKVEGTNMIVTGPNAAGKSTFIKSIIVNVLLSQTLGIACAKSFSFTPFYFINSQINIPDSKGVESLFEAEMYRCKYNLDIIKQIDKKYKALVIMDELFNSTNVVEGIAAGYSILNTLSSHNNVLTILTTHYPYLTKVPNYVRYKIDATVDENDEHNIIYKYKLSKGVSKQYLALNILKKNGFDADIIDFAKEIQKRILV